MKAKEKIEQFEIDLLKEMLAKLPQNQIDFFWRVFKPHCDTVESMNKNQRDSAIALVERSLDKINERR